MRPPGFGSALPAWMWPQTTTSVGVPHASVNTALVYEASGRRAAKKNASKYDIPSPSNQWPAAALSSQPPSTESAARRRYLWWPTARGHTHTRTHTSPSRWFFWFCSVLLCCSSGVPGHVSRSHRKVLEEAPLMTKSLRESQMKEKMEKYPKVSAK